MKRAVIVAAAIGTIEFRLVHPALIMIDSARQLPQVRVAFQQQFSSGLPALQRNRITNGQKLRVYGVKSSPVTGYALLCQ